MQPCEQHENIKRIFEDLRNHKDWRMQMTELTSDIKIICATMEERLKSKVESWDRHVEEGKIWRRTVAGLCVGFVLQFLVVIFSSGILFEKIHRLEVLHPYGVAMEPVQK